jgi:hypothetical protein
MPEPPSSPGAAALPLLSLSSISLSLSRTRGAPPGLRRAAAGGRAVLRCGRRLGGGVSVCLEEDEEEEESLSVYMEDEEEEESLSVYTEEEEESLSVYTEEEEDSLSDLCLFVCLSVWRMRRMSLCLSVSQIGGGGVSVCLHGGGGGVSVCLHGGGGGVSVCLEEEEEESLSVYLFVCLSIGLSRSSRICQIGLGQYVCLSLRLRQIRATACP